MRPHCTTCGSHEYREHLRQLAAPLGGPLIRALSDMDSSELISIHGWEGAIEIAIGDLPLSGQAEEVLKAWIPKIGVNLSFDDVVLFRIVRYVRKDRPVRTAWIDAAVVRAVLIGDFSLTETLILILGADASRYPELLRTATAIAHESGQMRRVLRNACGIQLPTPSRADADS